ncbi:MAG: cytochrome c oxidase subunit 3 [Syntrophobacteraceae bacterium]|nr:cytochrome c oxidase subunit 3 [Syntrophobacteraceae bacterium]
MNKIRLAMLLFVASEAVFFILLIVAYVVYHATSPSAADPSRYLDIPRTAVFTACLIASSFTMWRAAIDLRTGRRKPAFAWLLATMALGAVFLAGQGSEYLSLFKQNMTISRDLFGTTFFTLTGFHGLHVLIGLIMLGTLLGLELKRGVTGRPSKAVEGVSIYWHFVDAVWMVIFPVVYLWVLR